MDGRERDAQAPVGKQGLMLVVVTLLSATRYGSSMRLKLPTTRPGGAEMVALLMRLSVDERRCP